MALRTMPRFIGRAATSRNLKHDGTAWMPWALVINGFRLKTCKTRMPVGRRSIEAREAPSGPARYASHNFRMRGYRWLGLSLPAVFWLTKLSEVTSNLLLTLSCSDSKPRSPAGLKPWSQSCQGSVSRLLRYNRFFHCG